MAPCISQWIPTNRQHPCQAGHVGGSRQDIYYKQKTKYMNKYTKSDNASVPLRQAADDISESANVELKEGAQAANDSAGKANEATKKVAKQATEKTKELQRSASSKAEQALEASEKQVRRNPLPVLIGAIAFGASIGLLLCRNRYKRSLVNRYVDEPLDSVGQSLVAALRPLGKKACRGLSFARNRADRAMDRIDQFGKKGKCDALSHRMGRIGSNLKFW